MADVDLGVSSVVHSRLNGPWNASILNQRTINRPHLAMRRARCSRVVSATSEASHHIKPGYGPSHDMKASAQSRRCSSASRPHSETEQKRDCRQVRVTYVYDASLSTDRVSALALRQASHACSVIVSNSTGG